MEQLMEPISCREFSTHERIIMLEGSKLHGALFPPWTPLDVTTEFEGHFQDDFDFRLSQAQIEEFDSWQTSAVITESARAMQSADVTEGNRQIRDLVQDLTTDCSVVASMCAITARTEQGFENLLADIFNPWDPATEGPGTSPNGKYIFRLYFNGCYRRVVVDDRLPVSKSERRLFVVDRSDYTLLWPALIEKAYLKIRGGYDFPGSNSGTALWVLTGWIPEQLFIQRYPSIVLKCCIGSSLTPSKNLN